MNPVTPMLTASPALPANVIPFFWYVGIVGLALLGLALIYALYRSNH